MTSYPRPSVTASSKMKTPTKTYPTKTHPRQKYAQTPQSLLLFHPAHPAMMMTPSGTDTPLLHHILPSGVQSILLRDRGEEDR
jgi:hypothetical protein